MLLSDFAWAQNCDALPGFVRETFPASGSRSIPRNGVFAVIYCATEELLVDRRETRLLREIGDAAVGCGCPAGLECLEVGLVERCLEEVPTSLELIGDEVRLQTPELLDSLTPYVIEAPEPRGPVRVRFTTGNLVDEAAPVFSGIESLDVDGCGVGFRDNVACPSQLEEEGFIVILEAPAAEDEAGAVNIEYRAYQIRGEQRIERGRTRGDGVSDVALSVFVAGSDLTSEEWERICFSMTARDPYGHERIPDRVLCELTPEFSPFGNACSVTSRNKLSRGLWLPFFMIGLVIVFRAYSRRNRRR